MGPDVWGPHGWKFLHFVTLGYPENPTSDDKKKYKTFFSLIQTVLPCGLCAANYKKHLKEYPITDEILANKTNLISWCIKMHNLVNIENNSKVYSDDEALKLILSEKSCPKSNESYRDILIIAVIILAISLLLLYKQISKKIDFHCKLNPFLFFMKIKKLISYYHLLIIICLHLLINIILLIQIFFLRFQKKVSIEIF